MMVEVEVNVVVWDENQEQEVGGGGGGGGGRVFNLPSSTSFQTSAPNQLKSGSGDFRLLLGDPLVHSVLALGDFFENH